eukprot:GILK01002593.1.p1 GENE.GILK01002593.1~~GILK01002593.1.p1  ORF type:complete len:427 (-),score=72.27 GILK01002593.1:107-1387(-)
MAYWFALCVFAILSIAHGFSWANWDRRQSCHPLTFQFPDTEEAIVNIVKFAAMHGQKVKVYGAGHSFSPIALTTGHMISLDKYASLVSIDGDLVTVQAGMRLKDLNELLDRHGLALPNLGAIAEQSVAGAISTSTHGTGRELGSIATRVEGLRLITGTGQVVDVSALDHADIFAAARVGLGCIGILSTVTVRAVPAFKLLKELRSMKLSDLIHNLPQLYLDHPRMQFYWLPYSTDATVLTFTETNSTVENCWTGSDPNTCIDKSYKALTHNGDATSLYTEMEYFIPVENTQQAVSDILEFQRQIQPLHNSNVSLFTGVRFVARDDIWLSPMFDRDIAVVSMIVFGDANQSGDAVEFERYARGVESICLRRFNGRPHWGKRSFVTANDIQGLYPRWKSFLELRKKIDPFGVFMNDHLYDMLGVSPFH